REEHRGRPRERAVRQQQHLAGIGAVRRAGRRVHHRVAMGFRHAIVVLAALGACGSPETKIEYDPYAGPPVYPDKRPKLPAAKGSYAFVSDSLSDTVSVLDVPANEVIAQVPVGRDPIGIDGPHHLAVDKDGNVYVALSYP